MLERIEKLRAAMAEAGIDGFISVHPVNRQYLCGFPASPSYLIITPDRAVVATLFLSLEEAQKMDWDLEVVRVDHWTLYHPDAKKLHEIISELGIKRLAYEEEYVTAAFVEELRENLPELELCHGNNMLAKIKAIKDPHELDCMRKACAIVDRAFAETVEMIKPGVTEAAVSNNLFNLMKAYGGDPKFQVVLFGERTSMPHGQPSGRTLKKGDMITIDMGCAVEGYYSDMTRGLILGAPDEKQLEIYNIVHEAQRLAGEAIRPGVTANSIDKIARDYISKFGYGDCFGHSLGHGMGLSGGAEMPLICNTYRGEVILQPNMCFSNEPGIYIPDWGGWRVEDTVAVTETGSEIMTKTSKDLLIL